ncbi:uncharacterized protein LOC6586668 [Drosophila mojavensis]|uniref:Uncharacterized protein n=1 Tax=Drosophila mojavensis TaxID=7230 RepID=B4L9N4_DROMO|nr:uncharacterized protein LOC6586668 [Drosophila mojavensis]EDW17409.1 uncharacterized protein Dmoj_GI16522 [Drosophila mojavensis]
MFKTLFVWCALCVALGQARPSYLPSYEAIEYAPTVLGYEHYALPAAISHQSSTVVHEKRPYLRPIYEHHPTTYTTYAGSPLGYSSEWYSPGWNAGALSYPSIYLK